MRGFRRLFQHYFIVSTLAVATASFSAQAQDMPAPPPDQQQTYPVDQAPPPPADQAGQSTYPTDQAPPPPAETAPSVGGQAGYPAEQAPPSLSQAPYQTEPAPSAGQPLPSDGSQAGDPSGRVGRLGYMSGSVSVQPQGTGDWVQGSANRPLTNGDNVWADQSSRAELNLGTGLMRISSESSLTLTNVTNDAVQVQLHQGTLNVHVRKLYDGEVYEVDTQNIAFTINKGGDYRFDVDPNADTTIVTVWKGEGEATGQGPSVRVREGEQARFTGGTSLAHQTMDAPRRDGFDDWCKVRDKHEDESVSAQYVAPGVVGASDLDEYGSWRNTPEYGNVWVPSNVGPGWAPYSDGQWMWQAPWGWTWVDAAPWGFAPFHYGRWVDFGPNWGWAPGPYWERPFYAPALVAWFGGPHFGIGINFGFGIGFGGGFGWCPLGFGEPFFPWYGASRGYFRNVNISNTRINNFNHIVNNYGRNGGVSYGRNGVGMPRYATRPGAMTAVSRNTLERGLSVAGNRVNMPGSALRNLSSASLDRPNISPTRASVLGSKAGTAAAHPASGITSRPTVSRMTPPRNSGLSKPSPAIAASHNGEGTAGRNAGSPMANRGSSASSIANRGSEGRSLASSSPAASRNVSSTPQSSGRSFPAASAGAGARSEGMTGARPGASPGLSASRSVPRPPASSPTMSARNMAPSVSSGSRSSAPYFGRGTPSNNVPRPTGRVQPAAHSYSSGQGGYSARSYGGVGYGGNTGSRGYSGGSYGGSRGYSGGSYSAPSRSYSASRGYSGSSYGGSSRGYSGRSYSAPSSHGSGSFGGGRGYSGSHGSFGGHASSGGSPGGGGSHGGGGGHGGGGSHGGHR